MQRILITGASGFVGRVLVEQALGAGHAVTAAYRQPPDGLARNSLRIVQVGDLEHESWEDALTGVDTIVHAAGRAHVMKTGPDSAQRFLRVNTDATRSLALTAARHGVRRLVYVSSIKVNGELTRGPTGSFRETDTPQPSDPYAHSKLATERALWEVAATTKLEVAIVRPPLVFGPGVRANFLALMRWIDRGVPLPLGSVRNRRTLVSVWNLCDLLLKCAQHPAAAGQVFLAGDARPLSIVELIELLAEGLGRRPRLVPVPLALLRVTARVFGRQEQLRRLSDSLIVDTSKAQRELGWEPVVDPEEALRRTARWYRDGQH
jgi:nucleoside-diphosphate-sugar epimerase